MKNSGYIIILFYKFVEILNPEEIKKDQKELCTQLHLKGRILIGREGINGTLEGTVGDIGQYIKILRQNLLFSDIVFKESIGTGNGFHTLRIKIRNEIVTLGVGAFDIKQETATRISADELDRLYENNHDFIVLDMRNDYEIDVGYFDRTFDLRLKNFRDLPDRIHELKPFKEKKIIAVCTGGIRCEKATCLLRREGFTNVYQLENGIHAYLQQYPGKHFNGSLFVFDNRMTTPIVDTQRRTIVGKCVYCGLSSEDFYSNDSVTPSVKMVCCSLCATQHADMLRKCGV